MHNVSLWGIFAILVLIINVATFLVYGIDKRRARRHKWRIPESVLLALAALGGGLGAFTGMRVFHHKTNHKKFIYLVPTLMIAQVALILWALTTIDFV